MSVNREHQTPISSTAKRFDENQTSHNAKDEEPAKDAVTQSSSFKTEELTETLRQLGEALRNAALVVQGIFNQQTLPPALSTITTNRTEPQQSQPVNEPPEFQSKTAAANEQPEEWNNNSPFAKSRLTNSSRMPVVSENFPNNDPTGAALLTEARQAYSTHQSQGPTMSRQDATELLVILRQLGEAFFQQGRDGVTRQELRRELDGLRRLMENKK